MSRDRGYVVLDASTTALQIARALRRRPKLHDVTVITNGVHTALELLEVPGLSTILTGGLLRATAVVDHTKLGQVGLATFVPLASLSMLITDSAADPAIVAELESVGVEVQLV